MPVAKAPDGILDITERKRLEDRVREAFRSLSGSAGEGERLLTTLIGLYEHERRRVLRDIHDDPLQLMTTVARRLALLRHDAPSPLAGELLELEELARQATNRIRRILSDRSNPDLSGVRLLPCLQARLHQLQSRERKECVLRNRLRGEPPAEVQSVLLRIATGALANVSNHAEASLIEVCLDEWDGGVGLRIRDDGIGFDPGRAEDVPGHLGLRVMRERAELAGGWLDVETAPGKGTTVACWIPVRAAEE